LRIRNCPLGTHKFSRRGPSVDVLPRETSLAAGIRCNTLVRLEYLDYHLCLCTFANGILAPRHAHYCSSFGLSAYAPSSLRRAPGRSCPLATISAANATSALTSAVNGIPIVPQ